MTPEFYIGIDQSSFQLRALIYRMAGFVVIMQNFNSIIDSDHYMERAFELSTRFETIIREKLGRSLQAEQGD